MKAPRTLTPQEITKLFPRASKSVLKANAQPTPFDSPENSDLEADRAPADAEPELAARNETQAPDRGQKRDARSRKVRITSFRVRLLDPGANLWGGTKYLEDCLRYAGLIHDDSEAFIEISVRQERVRTHAEERTEVEIDIPLNADATENP